MTPPLTLSTTEQDELAATPTGTKALAIIVGLRAQCQRDFELAAEWKERYEAARTDAEVLRTRLENPHR